MRHLLRKVAALGIWGWVTVTLGLASPGCTHRLGLVQATQRVGWPGRANLPDITVERAKECVELDGRQWEKGRIVLESTVEVNEDGDTVGVTVGGIPETARDFGVCIRKVLQDMPIAEPSLHDAVKTLKFNRQHAGDSDEALDHFMNVVPGVPIVESELVLEADGYTFVLPVTVKVVAKLEELLAIDEAALQRVGQMALNSLGYDEIMRRAEQAGWVKTVRKTQPKTPAGKGLIGQSETEVVVVMFEVFTEYAVTAGVVSQLDSPIPGPADLAAIGILAMGLCKAGAVAYDALTTATAPAPASRPPPPPPAPPPAPPPPPPPPKKCLPCVPVPVGGLGYVYHSAGAGNDSHYGMAEHTHHFKMHQSPPAAGCRCFWDRNFIHPTAGFSPLPGAVLVVSTPGGGGIAP